MKKEFRFIGNSDLKGEVDVLRLTEKTVFFSIDGFEKKAKIFFCQERKPYFYPLGRYSMAPIVRL